MTRSEIVKFLNDKNTYNTIMGILDYKLALNANKDILTEYPTHSFIAGGAVANTIHYLLNKDKFDAPIINDVDLFCIERTNQIDYGLGSDPNNFIHTNLNEEINMDGYGRVWRGAAGDSLTMVSSNRFGILNEVKITVRLNSNEEFNEINYYLEILKVFDLNCCSAGIDRVNEKIIYNDKFVDFLLTNKIEVTNIDQPLQTTYRLHKKIKELKTDESNLNTEMSLIKHSKIIGHRFKWIGPEWISKVKVNNGLFHKYFEKYGTTNYIPFDGAEAYTIKDFKLEKYISSFYFNDNNTIIAFWDLFVRKKNVDALNKVLKFYDKIGHIKKDNKINFIKKLFKKKETYSFSDFEKNFGINYGNSESNIINFISKCPNYLNCDFEVGDLIRITNFNKFLTSNTVVDCSVFLTDNIKDHIKMIDYFYKRFMKNGVFRDDLFNRVILKQKNKTKISSFNYDEKIKSIEKILNDLWIKDYHNDYYGIKHKFIKYKKFNTIDLNDDFVF